MNSHIQQQTSQGQNRQDEPMDTSNSSPMSQQSQPQTPTGPTIVIGGPVSSGQIVLPTLTSDIKQEVTDGSVPSFPASSFNTMPSSPYPYYDSKPDSLTEPALSDFLVQLEDYVPTVPDSVANYYLNMAGFETTDPRISRLISISAQKFISDIINEAFTHSKLKGTPSQTGKMKAKDKKYTLILDDLIPVLQDYGITVRKPPYYV